MRVLGDLVGVNATACYRHFTGKTELLTAMLDNMLGQVLEAVPEVITDPRGRLEAQCMAMRRVMHENPQLAAAMAASEGQMPNALEMSRRSIAALRSAGLDGDELVRAYQMIESYVMGATQFDLIAAPHNMEIRAARYGAFDDPAFTEAARSVRSVDGLTEEAFVSGLRTLLDDVLGVRR
jgi:AcrR family transcriptional regulator